MTVQALNAYLALHSQAKRKGPFHVTEVMFAAFFNSLRLSSVLSSPPH